MVNLISKVAIVGVVCLAVLYQLLLKRIIFDLLGVRRHVMSIKDFNHVQCQRVDDLGLEACEDMWLHEKTGFLYLACTSAQSRVEWNPAIDHLNASGRGMNDRIAVLDTRGTGPVSSRLQWLSAENFVGINGDGTLNLLGLDILADKNTDTLRILLVNVRPPLDPITGEPLDASVVGANSTIEQFITKAGTSTMKHVRTYANPVIKTPNNIAWVSDHAFVFTNDHTDKVGWRRQLERVLGGGSVGYCDRNRCNIAWDSGFNFPNGLAKGRDGLIYVPNTLDSFIDVFSLGEDHMLTPVNQIKVDMPLDNLSVDKNGDIFASGFPKVLGFVRSGKNPFGSHPPTTVLRIRRGGKGYEGIRRKGHLENQEADYYVEKILEDNGSVLPCASTVVHDAETGKFFLGGPASPYIAICETR
ncbi:calcium-dependent phosphotriesterase [Mollisia scopiformis]|uniref:Calcium-dependent phosphotriesterase n=1 Tax=Mollisia scopiformis TaxID=149040 RepID=A0A194XHV2_MOLSC|nr:calcium-dependent phosphotriesterase [Mollisia scopiformis]KUJ19738.1 calcium-dependent phosphotriesterase [Mollisia scopiformis]